MDRYDGTLHALSERLDEASGPDPTLERDICDAYIAALAGLARQGKLIARLGMLASRAMADSNGGETLRMAADSSLLLHLVGAMEDIDGPVCDAYESEYGKRNPGGKP